MTHRSHLNSTTLKNIRRKVFHDPMHSALKIFMALLALTLIACGSSNDVDTNTPQGNSVHVGNLPEFFFSELGDGTLRATLEVYGPDGALAYSENLQINESTGEIFSSQFNLPTGFTYTFIVTFFFQPTGGTELPVGFVVKIASTEGGSLALFWEESEVVTSNGNLSPDISASMSTTNIPNLDADGDGYDNFSEFREGSDPTNPNDVPLPPALIEQYLDLNLADFIEFKLVFQDASGISNIAAVGDKYVCGFYDWTIQDVTPDGRTKELHAKFNLHAHKDIGDKITLSIQATDVLGLSKVYDIEFSPISKTALSADDPLNKPEIAILSPQPGETVSGTIQVHAIACDEDGIGYMTVSGFSDVLQSTSGELSGPLDTTRLGDQQQKIIFLASPTGLPPGQTESKFVFVNVANNTPIKIDYPSPSEVLSDGFSVAAHVDKALMPNVANLFIQSITGPSGNEIYGLNQLKFDVNSLPEAFTGQVFNTSQVDNIVFTIKYVAVGTDGIRVERDIRYEISNKPKVFYFRVGSTGEPQACIVNGSVAGKVNLAWSVSNTEIAKIGSVSLAVVGGASSGNLLFDCTTSFNLHAERTGIDQSTGLPTTYQTDQPLNLSLLNLVDHPDLDAAVDGTNFKITFQVSNDQGLNPNNVQWKVDIDDPNTPAVDFPGLQASGLIIDGGDFNIDNFLAKRTQYRVNLYLLNSEGQVVSTLLDAFEFLTGAPNLVGWYRFNKPVNFGWDYSGKGNDNTPIAIVNGGSDCLAGFDTCGLFNGSSSFMYNDDFPQTTSMTIDLWVNWDAGPGGEIPNGVILYKQNQFELRVDGETLKFILWENDGGTLNPKEAKVSLNGSGPGDPDVLPNTWYQVIATYNSTPSINKINLEIVDFDTALPTSGPSPLNTNDNLVFIGRSFSGGPYFNGLLDEIAIYDAVVP